MTRPFKATQPALRPPQNSRRTPVIQHSSNPCITLCMCVRESESVFLSVTLDLYLCVGRLRRRNEPMHIATVALATLRCTFSWRLLIVETTPCKLKKSSVIVFSVSPDILCTTNLLLALTGSLSQSEKKKKVTRFTVATNDCTALVSFSIDPRDTHSRATVHHDAQV